MLKNNVIETNTIMTPTEGVTDGQESSASQLRQQQETASGGLREVFTDIASRFKRNPKIASTNARRTFNNLPYFTAKVQENHSHGKCAAHRGAAVDFSKRYAEALGRPLYCIQHAQRDIDNGTAGGLTPTTYKQMDLKPMRRHNKPGIRSYVDVDYHLPDFRERLIGARDPVIIYTENPENAACTTGEYIHWFRPDGTYAVRVSGGGSFEQKLWDYSSDCITVSNRTLGLVTHTTAFHVDRRQVTPTKMILLLTPIGTWWGIPAMIADCQLASTELGKLNAVHNGWVKIMTQTKEGIVVSVAKASETPTDFVTLPLEDFEAARNSNDLQKQLASLSSTNGWVGNKRSKAALLAVYLREDSHHDGVYTTSVENAITRYTADVVYHDTGNYKSGMSTFMNPIVHGGAFDPIVDDINGRWAVKDRITDFQGKGALNLGLGRLKYTREFVEKFAGEIGTQTKDSVDAVWNKQARATQRNIISQAINRGFETNSDISSFPKRETYAKLAAPRVISTIKGMYKVEYSRYIYPIADSMKQFKWYGFGDPPDIAQKVADLALGEEVLVETDYSRMDGHVRAELRELIEEAIIQLIYPGDDEVLGLMRKQYGQNGRIGQVEYKTGYARASGSPETSLFNTLDSACIAYVRLRCAGFDPNDAWGGLGLYAGDDGLERPFGPPKDYVKSATRNAINFGQVLKSNVVRYPAPPQFLARYFGDAWTGGLSSMCDVARQLAKFHTCKHMPPGITKVDKGVAKAKAYLLTDSESPIIGALCKSIVRTCGTRTRVEMPMNWWQQYGENNFPNEYRTWMDDVVRESLPDFRRDDIEKWLLTNCPLAPDMPTCAEVTVKVPDSVPLLVDGILHNEQLVDTVLLSTPPPP